MAKVLEGVRVGPLDPDATETFGQVSAQHSGRRLIRLHARMHPPVLKRALVKKLDEPRTAAVIEHLDEVREYLAGLEHDNGDPLLPEGSVLEGAQVRGERDKEQVLTFTYRVPSGRSAKWFAPYNADVLPDSYEEGTARTRESQMRERGIVTSQAWDSEGNQTEVLRRELGRARRREKALREQIEGARVSEDPDSESLEDQGAPDSRRDEVILEENERLGTENAEMRRRLAQLEQLVSSLPGAAEQLQRLNPSHAPEDDVASQDEPIEDYELLNVQKVKALLADESTSSETVEQILAYERQHANRSTVVKAAEQRLDTGS